MESVAFGRVSDTRGRDGRAEDELVGSGSIASNTADSNASTTPNSLVPEGRAPRQQHGQQGSDQGAPALASGATHDRLAVAERVDETQSTHGIEHLRAAQRSNGPSEAPVDRREKSVRAQATGISSRPAIVMYTKMLSALIETLAQLHEERLATPHASSTPSAPKNHA